MFKNGKVYTCATHGRVPSSRPFNSSSPFPSPFSLSMRREQTSGFCRFRDQSRIADNPDRAGSKLSWPRRGPLGWGSFPTTLPFPFYPFLSHFSFHKKQANFTRSGHRRETGGLEAQRGPLGRGSLGEAIGPPRSLWLLQAEISPVKLSTRRDLCSR